MEVENKVDIRTILQLGFINAIAGMSDGFLYAFLPVYGIELGFTPMMVGALLSMNRFVRFFTNRLVAFIASITGVKKLYVGGILLSLLVSLCFATMPPFVFWVIARVLWGLSFSIIRFSKLQYLSLCSKMGTAFGLSSSIGGSVQIISYFLGSIIIATYPKGMVFMVYAFLLVLCIPLLYRVPTIKIVTQDIKLTQFQLPNKIDLWGFLTNFSLDGILIVGISALMKFEGDQENILFGTALFISIRRAIGIVFAPLFGIPIDRLGLFKSYIIMVGMLLSGIVLVIFDHIIPGLIVIFIGATANQTLVPLLRIQTCQPHQQFSAVTRLNSSQDMGAAFGALFGLSLILSVHNALLFSIIGATTFGLSIIVGQFIKKQEKMGVQFIAQPNTPQ
ncbi:MFS transporter [Aquiflexum sp.]|uniref:MFS transporter n=1 Tax=Aquiflexum sp. TaxID=1872584 RepID=UPI0035946AE0